MTRTLRSATALATSLSLIVPSLPMTARAQDASITRETALAACQTALGTAEGEAVEACLTDALVAAGIDPEAADAAAAATVEAEAEPAEAVDAPEAAEAPEVAEEPEAPEVVEAPAEAEPEAVDVEVTEDAPVDAAPEAETPAPELAEDVPAPAEVPTEESIAEELTEDAVEQATPAAEAEVTEAPVEAAPVEESGEVAEEAPAVEVVEGAEDPVVDVATPEQPVETAEEAPAAEETLVERIEEPVESDAAAPGTAQEEVLAEDEAPTDADAVQMTRQDARQLCRAEIGGGQREAVQACMVETLAENGQTDLAQRLADRFAARAEGDVNAATESAVAEEIASQPEPELTEAEELARAQTEAALANLEEAGTPAAAAAAADDDETEAEVTEEVVEAEDVRTSSEDFETSAVETERDRDDDGLLTTQKIAIGALGALAVGTLLNNRTRVISNSGDRVVVQRDDGDLQVLKDDDALLRQAGSNIRTQSFSDGSTRSIVTREDGSQVITVRDASLRVLRRLLIRPDGSEVVLIDDTAVVEPVDVSTLPPATLSARQGQESDPLRDALRRETGLDRRFSLAQVRNIAEVRALAPAFEVESVTFASASAAITPEQAGNLTDIAREVISAIRENPREVFLIEGHTDAVGDAAYNLALSDRRAESLALALNEYFDVPVENMVVQGYGERFLKVPTLEDERQNRRATVRRITELLQTAAAN
ncbi:MAG: OmpA family protein [Pseudomonadota bacterium]